MARQARKNFEPSGESIDRLSLRIRKQWSRSTREERRRIGQNMTIALAQSITARHDDVLVYVVHKPNRKRPFAVIESCVIEDVRDFVGEIVQKSHCDHETETALYTNIFEAAREAAIKFTGDYRRQVTRRINRVVDKLAAMKPDEVNPIGHRAVAS